MIEEVALPYLNLIRPRRIMLQYESRIHLCLLLSSHMQTIPTFSGIFVLILNKRLLITSIIRSSQRGQRLRSPASQFLAFQLCKATTFFWCHLCNAFIHLWRNGRSISSFRSASALAGCNGRKLTGRSKLACAQTKLNSG